MPTPSPAAAAPVSRRRGAVKRTLSVRRVSAAWSSTSWIPACATSASPASAARPALRRAVRTARNASTRCAFRVLATTGSCATKRWSARPSAWEATTMAVLRKTATRAGCVKRATRATPNRASVGPSTAPRAAQPLVPSTRSANPKQPGAAVCRSLAPSTATVIAACASITARVQIALPASAQAASTCATFRCPDCCCACACPRHHETRRT